MTKTLLPIALGSVLLLSIKAIHATQPPNILWITSEDNSIEWISCYGSKNAHTPHIDQLAKEGFRYTHCFDNGAVCAPTRSTWITGMHAISNGTQPMRSSNEIPPSITYYNEQLQKAGYYTSNCAKTDYNLSSKKGRNPKNFWNYSGNDYANTSKNRRDGQPFFTVLNLMDSHESRAFGSLRKGPKNPAKMTLAPYHPDLPELRETYAIYAGAVEKMDSKVGQAIAQLKADGLYDSTIIIYNSDHGGVLPRSKRFLYSSGIHCPLIIRIPEKWQHLYPQGKAPGSTVERIVSFIDMPKTWLSLAGADIPEHFQGRIFLGKHSEPAPQHHFSWRGRADARYDCVRVIRDEQYAYHKNYMPYAPAGQYLQYMHNMKGTRAWETHHKKGKTNAITGRFFQLRVPEEFYDNKADFHNIHNLIQDPQHQEKITQLKADLRRQQLKYFDSGLLPENLRSRRAKDNQLTIYEMVRDPQLYPLESYLAAADLALAADKQNLPTLIKGLSDSDLGIRYWSIIGLLLLEKEAAPAVPQLKKLLNGQDEIPPYAAWTLYKAGEKDFASDWMLQAISKNPQNNILANILDWMGEDAKPILTKFAKRKPQKLKKSLLKDILLRSDLSCIDQD